MIAGAILASRSSSTIRLSSSPCRNAWSKRARSLKLSSDSKPVESQGRDVTGARTIGICQSGNLEVLIWCEQAHTIRSDEASILDVVFS